MENETCECSEDSFAVVVGKSFISSAAVTAGLAAGLVVVGIVSDRLKARKNRTTEVAEEQ